MPFQRQDIKDLSADQLAHWLTEQGEPAYRAAQIRKWLYTHQADDFEAMTNLSKGLRQRLAEHFSCARLQVAAVERSVDGCRKYLFQLQDGKFIESVLMPETDRSTLCISSQVGCAQGCRFCLTAKGGLVRNLSAGEIIAQVRDMIHLEPEPRLTNIVVMGMGEPLANYANMIAAIGVITDADAGLGISKRRFTLSTAGMVSRLEALGRDTDINLAISLNAADDDTRSALMPINRTYPLAALMAACRRYPLTPRGRITFEYILMDGVNDADADAERLSKLLHGVKAKINLIPFNDYPGSPYRRPSDARVAAFQDALSRRQHTVMVRMSRGQDISAACGQLRANVLGKADTS
ncbi:MAG: 23S rRNA (adenine(2503)-C(2))-methyltransferase RlmN [Pseudomonadota bacterium]